MDDSTCARTPASPVAPRRLTALATASLLAVALTGCVSITSSNDEGKIKDVTRSVSTEGHSALLGTWTLGGPAQAALLEGQLVLGAGNCFQVLDAGGTVQDLLLPRDTAVIGGAVPGLEIDGKKFSVGETVAFGGGFSSLSDKARQGAGSCAGEKQIFTVQSLEG